MTTKTRQKPQRDRHQEILEAASRVITDRGLAETRIQDIAEACGVSPGLILYYFESKDRLLVEALTYASDQFYLRTARELRKMPAARDRLIRVIELSVPGLLPEYDLLDEWALWLEIWVRALRDPEIAKEREVLDRRWVQTIAELMRYGRQTGEFPTEEHDADELARAVQRDDRRPRDPGPAERHRDDAAADVRHLHRVGEHADRARELALSASSSGPANAGVGY